ncbi:MAG: enoyl-CoA hydratase/isomerase family protein [Micrococcales bacterium]|nr:enoyl-CoA hydratase/isomerase family protein [Micrococcales bacterium]
MTLTPPLSSLTADADHLVVCLHESGIAEVVLANPAQRNAMSGAMTRAWAGAMAQLREQPGLRAVLVRGEGGAFCAGGDLGWLAEGGADGVEVLSRRMSAFYADWLSIAQLAVPTVAFVEGPAIGAGAAVALACDIRWVGQSARFSVPFTRLGLHAGMGTTFLLTQAAGPALARDLLLTGRSLDASQMLAAGIATRQVTTDDVLVEMAQIAGNAPIAVRLTKQGLSPAPPSSLAEAVRWEALAQPVTMTTADVQEGLRAARERRDPVFDGR